MHLLRPLARAAPLRPLSSCHSISRPAWHATPAAARRFSQPAQGGTKEQMSVESLKDFQRANTCIKTMPRRTCITNVNAAMGGGKEHLAAPLATRGVYGPGKLREGV